MSQSEWSQYGAEIRKSVHDAIQSRNYSNLESDITNTVNNAIASASNILSGNFHTNYLVQNQESLDLKPELDDSQKTHTQLRIEELQRKRRELVAHNQHSTALTTSQYYMNVSNHKTAGFVLSVVGLSVFGSTGLGLLGHLVATLATGNIGVGATVGFAVLGSFVFTSAVLSTVGLSLYRSVNRFKKYIKTIGKHEYINIEELAASTNTNPKKTRTDIKKMIRRGWFKQGKLSTKGDTLMLSDDAYRQYLEMSKQRSVEQLQVKEEHTLDPAVKEVIHTGEAYLDQIRAYNTSMKSQAVVPKIYNMEQLVERILQRVRTHPASVSEVRRFIDYYLPTTVKLLDAYKILESEPLQGENIVKSRQEIETALDSLLLAFEKILDGLFETKAWDLSSDISVLQTMLANEGLVNSDFTVSSN